MATAQNIIRTLTFRSTVEGADKTKADLKGIQSAHEGVVRVTDTSAKGHLSLADAVAKAERRFNTSIRAQQDFEKVQRQMNLAVAQNPALQARANAVLAQAAQHFDQVSRGQRAFSTAVQAANDNLRGFAGNAGIAGQALLALGPWGIAAAAGIGVAVYTLNLLSKEVGRFADEMGKLRDTAQIIDLTTTQLQALNDKGAEFALTPDKIATGLQRFTAQLEEARRGEGELFTQMQRLDPAMALQFARTRDTASALDLYSSALNKANAAERVALSKAGLGRGGFDVGLMLSSVGKGGGLNPLTEEFKKSGDAIDTEIIAKVRQLKREIDDMASDARNNLASVFSVQTLEAEKKFTESWLEFSRSVKSFGISGDLRFLLETIAKIQIGGPGTMLGDWFGVNAGGSYRAPPAAARPDTFAQRYQPAIDNPLKITTKSELDRNAVILDLKLYRERVAVLGEAATASERYQLRVKEINAAVANNITLQPAANRALAAASEAFKIDATREMVSALGSAATAAEHYDLQVAGLAQRLRLGAISQETFNRAVEGLKADAVLTFMRNNVSALGGSATAAEQYEVRVAELQQQLDRGQISQDTFNRAVRDADPYFQLAKSSANEFGQALASNLQSGKGFSDSLGASLKSLSQSLTSGAITSLINGDFAMAAVKGIMAIGSAIASSLFGDKSGDHKRLIDTLDRLNQLRVRQIAATSDNNTLEGQMNMFNANAALELIDEARKGGALIGALLQVQNEERLAIQRDFASRQVEIDKQASDERIALAKAIADRQLSFQDRVFAAANDNSTLAGQLAALDRAAQREIIAERDAGGQAMADLEAAQLAERFNLIRDFNDKILDETKRAEEARLTALNGAAKSVVDYLAGLQSGPNATVSPLANLSNSQSLYNANLALAQGENLDAQNKFSSLADNLEKAARAVYASSQGYQDIRSQILSQGLALPAVVQTTDPVVQAIRDSISAIHLTTAAVDVMRLALSTAIQTQNPANIASALSTYFNQLNTTADAGLTFSELVAGVTGLSRDTTTSGLLTQDQIDSLGFARNATVGQLLTSTQLAGLGLSRDATVSALDTGNLLKIFQTLDVDGDGTLSRLDLIKSFTEWTGTSTYASINKLDQSISGIYSAVGNLNTVIDRFDTNNTLLDAIKGLQNTANTQLTLLRDQLTIVGAGVTSSTSTSGSGISVAGFGTSNSNMLTALNKIVLNTHAISLNTYGLAQNVGRAGTIGALAAGGTIPPHGLALVSEHLNPTWVRAGAEPITVSPHSLPTNVIPFPSRGFAGNDSAVVAELREVRRELAETRRELAAVISGSGARGAQATVETGEKTVKALDRSAETRNAQERQSNRQRKVA